MPQGKSIIKRSGKGVSKTTAPKPPVGKPKRSRDTEVELRRKLEARVREKFEEGAMQRVKSAKHKLHVVKPAPNVVPRRLRRKK